MLFMVVESFRPGAAVEIYRRLRDRGRMAPEGVRYLSSWVDLEFRRCYQLMEAESEESLGIWMLSWEDLVEFEVVPVRTSAEAERVMAPRL